MSILFKMYVCLFLNYCTVVLHSLIFRMSLHSDSDSKLIIISIRQPER